MILQFRKDIFSKEEPVIYGENGEILAHITRINGGALFTSARGQTIGQIFLMPNGASVTLADSAPLFITNTGEEVQINPASYGKNDLTEVTDPNLHRLPDVEYILFGKAKQFQYTLYERKLKEIKPRLIATVIPCPIEDFDFKVRPEKDSNVLKTLLIVTAVALLSVR